MLVTFLIIYRHVILRTKLFTQLGINVKHPSKRGKEGMCPHKSTGRYTYKIFFV